MASAGRTIGAPAPPPTVKPPELEDPLNRYIYHPLARGLAALLAPTGVSPNAVSAMSAAVVWAAALCYVGLDWPLSVLLGFGLHLSWHVFDGADGELARRTGKVSPLGELVDGVADYSGHVFLYTLLAVMLFDTMGHWCWPFVLLSGVSRIAQSNHAESQRRTYLWRVYGVPWLKQTAGGDLFQRRGLIAWIFIHNFLRGYLKLASATAPHSAEIDAALDEVSSDPREREHIARLCRHSARASILLQHALGANPRTIILGIAMIAGSPFWFFLVEITLLNLVLWVSIRHQKSCNRAVVARLADGPAPPGHG
jgi:hypothetical protein